MPISGSQKVPRRISKECSFGRRHCPATDAATLSGGAGGNGAAVALAEGACGTAGCGLADEARIAGAPSVGAATGGVRRVIGVLNGATTFAAEIIGGTAEGRAAGAWLGELT